MKRHLTSCGIPGVGVVPYGFHLCHFYPSREELLDGLIPYFLAGVESHERCIWIGAAPLPAGEIRTEIAEYPTLDQAEKSGQLTIWEAAEWYGDPAAMNAEAIIQRWIDEEERALAAGYQGLRISGNTSFVSRSGWAGLMDYEKKLHARLQDRRIVTCCTYSRDDCTPVDVLEVTRRHHAALDRSGENWQVFLQDAP